LVDVYAFAIIFVSLIIPSMCDIPRDCSMCGAF
jgi:hypothetical protein